MGSSPIQRFAQFPHAPGDFQTSPPIPINLLPCWIRRPPRHTRPPNLIAPAAQSPGLHKYGSGIGSESTAAFDISHNPPPRPAPLSTQRRRRHAVSPHLAHRFYANKAFYRGVSDFCVIWFGAAWGHGSLHRFIYRVPGTDPIFRAPYATYASSSTIEVSMLLGHRFAIRRILFLYFPVCWFINASAYTYTAYFFNRASNICLL